MKRVLLAILALATTLAFAPPCVLGDSFGYKISGSKSGADANFGVGRGTIPGGIGESGIFSTSESTGTSGTSSNVTLGSGSIDRPVNGAFFFDNLLQPGNAQFGGRDNSGALVDLSGRELVLLSGTYGGGSSVGVKGGQFFFADKGSYHVSNELQKGNGIAARGNATALAVTPEPGSLFLLGTGLLGLALVLFWKAARRSTGS